MTSTTKIFSSVSQHGLKDVAQYVVTHLEQISVWLFQGELGAGKTTLIKQIGEALHVVDTMSSPTFSIINEYETQQGKRIYHFDFYRIKSEEEAYHLGTEEYFYSGHPCFVEWPEKIPSLVPTRYATITLHAESETERTIAIAIHDGEEENRI